MEKDNITNDKNVGSVGIKSGMALVFGYFFVGHINKAVVTRR